MTITGLALGFGGSLECNRYSIPYTDPTAAALTKTWPLFTLKKGSIILGVRIKHSTKFAGTAVTAVTVSVGSSGLGTTGLANAFDVFQAVAAGARELSQTFKDTDADEVINAYFTSVGGNLSALTAGSVEIDVLVANVTTPGV